MKSVTSESKIPDLIDFCKGLAIVLIFLVHWKGGWFGWQGVHIFITVSGFGLTYSCLRKDKPIQWKAWFVKRAERILPTYWLVSVLGFLGMVCFYLYKNDDFVSNSIKTFFRLLLDVLLLRNFSHQAMTYIPNEPLWFIPLIISFYLAFPILYGYLKVCRKNWDYLLLFGIVALFEFIYRGVAIYWLDGIPIGYDVKPLFASNIVPALNRIPDWFPFQQKAPFGFFPSRSAEFLLGMLAALAVTRNSHRFSVIFLNLRTAIIGFLLWLGGNLLLSAGLFGWIFSDLVIGIGLILITLYLAQVCQKYLPPLFSGITFLGAWSYYIFLTHYIVIYPVVSITEHLLGSHSTLASHLLAETSLLIFIVACIAFSSWLVMRFDKSNSSKIAFQKVMKIFSKSYS